VCPSVQHDEAGINLHANLVDYTELEIAKALARHSVEIGLSKHYAPNHVVLHRVRCKPRSETTRGMIAAFDSMLGGTIFDALKVSSDDFETSEQNPFGDECHLRSSRDPVGYSKGAPNPKHHS